MWPVNARFSSEGTAPPEPALQPPCGPHQHFTKEGSMDAVEYLLFMPGMWLGRRISMQATMGITRNR